MYSGLSISSLFSIEGKIAVVTGAAIGIGKAIAILFADAGATVVVADKDAAAAQEVLELLGSGHSAIPFDLRDDASILALFTEVERRHGGCDILVNNAAIFPKYKFDELTEAQWDEMQQVNVWGCFVAMREATRLMRKSGKGGRIINLSSIGGVRTAVTNQIAYNASKSALDSMTLYAAGELAADGILVNSVCPGAVKQLDPHPRHPDDPLPIGPLMTPGRILTGGAAQPHEIAGPILMLASAAGGHLTGQRIVIDGGFSVS